MIGIVVVSHGKLAHELVRAAEHVVGPQTAFTALSIEAEDDIDARRDEIRDTVKSCNQGKGVIILTDMFGGTPSNLALSSLVNGKIDVIGGVNLPMLIHLAQIRSELTLDEAVQAASDAGKRYIRIGSQVMSRSK
ncbi:MAG: PTS sugar transporter subunit IIA [Pseudomonadota bacterium]